VRAHAAVIDVDVVKENVIACVEQQKYNLQLDITIFLRPGPAVKPKCISPVNVVPLARILAETFCKMDSWKSGA